MTLARTCSRAGCLRRAVATLTYVYADQTCVLGPLATYAEPHCYDLCTDHADRLTAPQGWDVIRPAPGELEDVWSDTDDLEALANAVREAQRPPAIPDSAVEVARRGHLRMLTDAYPRP